MSGSRWIALGAISAGLAVGAGAFGAHGLAQVIAKYDGVDELTRFFNTAAQLHFGHSLALILVGILVRQRPHIALTIAGWCLLMGVVLFSGSLYVRVLSNTKEWAHLTPIGGVAFLIGWLLVAISGLRPHGARVPHSSLSDTIERP